MLKDAPPHLRERVLKAFEEGKNINILEGTLPGPIVPRHESVEQQLQYQHPSQPSNFTPEITMVGDLPFYGITDEEAQQAGKYALRAI